MRGMNYEQSNLELHCGTIQEQVTLCEMATVLQ